MRMIRRMIDGIGSLSMKSIIAYAMKPAWKLPFCLIRRSHHHHWPVTVPYRNCLYILYTKIVQDAYNWCIQNVCNMYPTYWLTFVYVLYTKLKELWQLNFVYKIYTKVYRNVEYILYTSIPIYKKCTNYVYNLYTELMQNICTNNCMQNKSHISTYFDSFVFH